MNIFDKKSVLALFAILLLICSSYADDHNHEARLLVSNGLINGIKGFFSRGKVAIPKLKEAYVKHQQVFKFGYKSVKGGYEFAGFGCLKDCAPAKPPCNKAYCVIEYVRSSGKSHCKKVCNAPKENCMYFFKTNDYKCS